LVKVFEPNSSTVRRATNGDLNFDSLMPHASCHRFESGATLFRKGDPALELFLITAGTVRLVELNVDVSEGALIGEIGVFSPHKARMATAVAITRVDVMTIAKDRVIAICSDNSDFGFYLLAHITKRMVANFESLERRVTSTR
jgi:CRP-like cAMP-binding protein